VQALSHLPSARGSVLRPAPGPSLPRSVRQALRGRGVDPDGLLARADEAGERRLETALMELFRDTRSSEAFDSLYRRSGPAMLSWIVHLLKNRPGQLDAAELMQDTFVNVYRYAGSFRSASGNTFRGWARTIAANVVRRAYMRAPLHSLQALPTDVNEPTDLAHGPLEVASDDEQAAALMKAWTILLLHYAQAFDKLSPRDRYALQLIEVEGVTYAEAGLRLKVGRSNMKMIMFRSRQRIRAHMRAAMGEPADAKRVAG